MWCTCWTCWTCCSWLTLNVYCAVAISRIQRICHNSCVNNSVFVKVTKCDRCALWFDLAIQLRFDHNNVHIFGNKFRVFEVRVYEHCCCEILLYAAALNQYTCDMALIMSISRRRRRTASLRKNNVPLLSKTLTFDDSPESRVIMYYYAVNSTYIRKRVHVYVLWSSWHSKSI